MHFQALHKKFFFRLLKFNFLEEDFFYEIIQLTKYPDILVMYVCMYVYMYVCMYVCTLYVYVYVQEYMLFGMYIDHFSIVSFH